MDFQRFFSLSTQERTAPSSSTDPADAEQSQDSEGEDYSLTLRRAKITDLQALTDLLTRSFHGQSNQPFWLQSILRFSIQEDLRQRLKLSNTQQACWVAIRTPSSQLQGQASVRPQLVGTVEIGQRSPLTLGWPLNIETWLAPNQTFLYISNLAIAQNFRRQGIAQKLLQRCEQAAITWKQPELYLHVLENNQPARNLYKRMGFGFERIDPSIESLLFNRDRRQLWRKQLPPQH